MYTVGIAVGFLAVAYAIQGVVVWHFAGGGWTGLYLLTLPLFGIASERYRDRTQRATARIRAYWHFRLDPQLQQRLVHERLLLCDEATAIEALANEPPTSS